jgi:predicted TIM-barrel fold metal-dependent hydrolase
MVPVVLDHLAYVSGDRPDDEQRLVDLLGTGRVWVKLSGFYRIDARGGRLQTDVGGAPSGVTALIGRLAAVAPDRLLWGSDWPHTPPHADDPRPRQCATFNR